MSNFVSPVIREHKILIRPDMIQSGKTKFHNLPQYYQAVEDTLEPISLLPTGVKGVAAETVPKRGKHGKFRKRTADNTFVSLSFEYRLCSENLPKHQPPKPTLVRAVKLNTIPNKLFFCHYKSSHKIISIAVTLIGILYQDSVMTRASVNVRARDVNSLDILALVHPSPNECDKFPHVCPMYVQI
ncbi:hypothetical protein ALC53_01071 [Atta colombica]|uniref:Uncharacterized protein n=1 Tax=Atta colombica TaxID=520822 RepID=A0A195BVG2_9HYME|nr:hypothetical protein ALC53_01071 [Atta colombica]